MKLALFLLLSAVAWGQQTSHAVTLTWTWAQGTGAPATGFQVYRAPATSGTTCPAAPASTTAPAPFTVIDTGAQITNLSYVDQETATNQLTEGATYCYAVTMLNNAISSAFSPIAGATIPYAPPATPTGLKAVAQ
jgi:hypothetical protein